MCSSSPPTRQEAVCWDGLAKLCWRPPSLPASVPASRLPLKVTLFQPAGAFPEGYMERQIISLFVMVSALFISETGIKVSDLLMFLLSVFPTGVWAPQMPGCLLVSSPARSDVPRRVSGRKQAFSKHVLSELRYCSSTGRSSGMDARLTGYWPIWRALGKTSPRLEYQSSPLVVMCP